LGNTGTASISVTVDLTPPRVIINSPLDGAVFYVPSITVSGMVNDIVSGTVNENNATITVNGNSGVVSNRSFSVEGVNLVSGTNTITAVGTDAAGNTAMTQITVTYDASSKPKIMVVSGDGQSGLINATLSQPLVVKLADAGGNPVPNQPVTFRVTRNNGVLNGGLRTVTLNTNSLGQAQVNFTSGSFSGIGQNRVEATSPGFAGSAVFTAAGLPGDAAMIHQVNESVFRGAVNAALPQPLQVIVSDAGGNPVSGVPVTFTIVVGSGKVQNDVVYLTTTNSDGKATATWILGPNEGISNNRVEATFEGYTGLPVTFVASGVIPGDPAQTTFSGIVLTNTELPIPGVTMTIPGTSLSTQTNDQGQFKLTHVPVGAIKLVADANTATLPGFPYKMMYEANTIAGRDNTIGMPLYLLPLDLPNAQPVSETQGATIGVSNVAGFSLNIPPGSVTFTSTGSRSGSVSVTQVHRDKVPMPPPNGLNPKIVFTIQPADAKFDPPAPIIYPNVYGYKPGQIVNLYSFDHDLEQWVSIGTGSVSEDGAFIASDFGVGIVHGGWHFPEPPPDEIINVDNGEDIFTDPEVQQELCAAFVTSNPSTASSHEEGGWILQDASGETSFLRWPSGGRKGIRAEPLPDATGQINGKAVVGAYHTHPTDGGPPSHQDAEVSSSLGIENHYVISVDGNVYLLDSTGAVLDIGDVDSMCF
jgi:hypothetical protein